MPTHLEHPGAQERSGLQQAEGDPEIDLDILLSLATELAGLQEAIHAAVYRAAAASLAAPATAAEAREATRLAEDPQHRQRLHHRAALYAQAVGLNAEPMLAAAETARGEAAQEEVSLTEGRLAWLLGVRHDLAVSFTTYGYATAVDELAGALLEAADEHGRTDLTRDALAQRVGRSPYTLTRYIAWLRRHGWLHSLPPSRHAGYRLTHPDGAWPTAAALPS
ncbi:hypothetical protein CLV92_11941 [Kineococcus xinjiangensis]|uniref:Uncharacterized protein n=1 Tax=Kineococcus xinjiangensis TaxID=512762 RepID=A0A2S6ICR7_9ACTN|nr:hypothetical protein [Kineococcus xinjiangensis]PPK91960.1 hypothetical protein CLV92_11941 [Kineococcus xinjiangensis]